MMKALKLIFVSAAVATLFAACGNNCRNQQGNQWNGGGYNMYNNPRCNTGFNNGLGYNGYNMGYNNMGYNNIGYNNIQNNAQSRACQQAYDGLYPGERWVAVAVGANNQMSCVSISNGARYPLW